MPPARASLFAAPMRGPGIIGKVTTEISHRSSRSSRRSPARSVRARSTPKPIDSPSLARPRLSAGGAGAPAPKADRQPVDGAAAHQRMDPPRPPDRKVELAAHAQAAGILGD